MLEVADVRKLAIQLQCLTMGKRSARDDYAAKLRAIIVRAPKIKFWS